MTMGQTYSSVIDANINVVYQKGIATKILQHMDRIRNVSDISQARRWVMELLQNSRDVAFDDQNVKVKICLKDDSLLFMHNGKPFRVQDILAIVNQVSSKNPDESTIGQFGTGFMTTYQLSEVVEIQSVLKEEGLPYKPFSVRLDRRGSKDEEILNAIFDSMTELKKADEETEISYDKDAYNTIFKYRLDTPHSYRIAKVGMDDLKDTILYVLLFTKKIEQIELHYDTAERKETIIYKRGADNKVTEELRACDLIGEHVCENQVSREWHVLLYMQEDGMTIAAEVDEEKNFLPISNQTPKVFVDFPLIGQDVFPFPIVMNNVGFKPNEPRSGITLVDNPMSKDALVNKELIEQAVRLYQQYLHQVVELEYHNLEAIVELPLWKPNKEWSECWVKAHIYRKLYKIIANEKIMNTAIGKMELSNEKLFLIEGEGSEKEGIKELVGACRNLYVPLGTERWYEALAGYEIATDKIISLKRIVSQAEEFLRAKLDEEKMSPIEWCQKLYLLCKENLQMAMEVKAGEWAIFPNQDQTAWSKRKLYTIIQVKKDGGIPEIFKDISEKLDEAYNEKFDVRGNLLHKEYVTEIDGVETYDEEKLLNYISSRTDKAVLGTKYLYISIIQQLYWKDALYKMLSCCPDIELYELCKNTLKADLPERNELDAKYSRQLWFYTCSELVEDVLKEVASVNRFDFLMERVFKMTEKEEVYAALNVLYKKVYEYKGVNFLNKYAVIPNQEGELRCFDMVSKDCDIDEELKEIAKTFQEKDSNCNVYRNLIDKAIDLGEHYIYTMSNVEVASRIHTVVLQILSEVSLPDAKQEYQEACTRLLGWIQEHMEEAKSFFPSFCREEDQMRLLTPKAAVGIQKKAKELKRLLDKMQLENVEELEKKLDKLKRLELLEEECAERQLYYDSDKDVFYNGEFLNLPEQEREDLLQKIGITGEKFALEQVKAFLVKQGYLEEEEALHKTKLVKREEDATAEIEYYEEEQFHQPGWDICVRITRAGKVETYYLEVKTHTYKSVKKNVLFISNMQMRMAAKCMDNYFVLMVYVDARLAEKNIEKYYRNPVKLISEGKLYNSCKKYELVEA